MQNWHFNSYTSFCQSVVCQTCLRVVLPIPKTPSWNPQDQNYFCSYSKKLFIWLTVLSFIFMWMNQGGSLAQRLKCLSPMWETRVWPLGWEDPLEKEMVTHCSILAWRIPWTEKPGGLQSTGSQRVRHSRQWYQTINNNVLVLMIMHGASLVAPGLGRSPGGGYGNLLRYSCLENPHRQRSLAGCSPWGLQRVGHDWVTKHSTIHYNAHWYILIF